MLSTDTSPTTATATPPFSAKLTITWGRSRRSSRRRMLFTGTNAISPPFTASNAGGRVRRAQAHSTLRSSPPPPPSRAVPGGRTPRHTSLTVIVGALMPRASRQQRSRYWLISQGGTCPRYSSHSRRFAAMNRSARRRQRQAALDPVEPAAEHHRKGEVGVARGIGAAQLHSGRLGASDVGHADERTSVGARPRDEDGRFEAANQALVGVHQRRKDRADPGGVVQLPGDEVLRDGAEPVRVVAGERVAGVATADQALVDVHPAARLPVEGLW